MGGSFVATVAEVRPPNPLSVEVRGVPAAAAERLRVREEIRPDEVREVVGTEALEVDDGETMGGLEVKPEGAPATTAVLSELEGDSAMESRVEM